MEETKARGARFHGWAGEFMGRGGRGEALTLVANGGEEGGRRGFVGGWSHGVDSSTLTH